VLLVPRRVGNDELALVGREVAIGHIDRDSLLPLVLEAVGKQREIDLAARSTVARGVLLNRGELIFIDHLRLVKEPPNQRALAVIDAPAGNKPQQLLALVLRQVLVDIRSD